MNYLRLDHDAGSKVLIAGLLALLTLATPSAAANSPMDDRWQGVYHLHPEPMNLRIHIEALEDGRLVGTVDFEPLESYRRNYTPFEGSLEASGSFDPATRTFVLRGERWLETPRQRRLRLVELAGVIGPEGKRVAGVVVPRPDGSSPYFVLARRGGEGRDLQKTVAKTVTNSPPKRVLPGGVFGAGNVFGGVRRMLSDAPGAKELVSWAARLEGEYADIDRRRRGMGSLYDGARNLFADEHFEPYFSKTYTELGRGERMRIRHAIEQRDARRRDEALANYNWLASAFSERGSFSATDITISVIAQRVLRAWRADALERLGSLTPQPGVFDRIDRLEQAFIDHTQTLWPSEQAPMEQFSAVRRKLAPEVLAQKAKQALNGPDSYDHALTLAAWADDNHALLELVSPEQREGTLAQVKQRLDAILAPLVADELAMLTSLGQGEAAVRAGNRWLRDFSKRYGFASDSPSVRGALVKLQSRRNDDLEAARTMLVAQIEERTRIADVDQFITAILAVPGDRRTPAGRALLAQAMDRKASLNRDAQLRYFSDRERSLVRSDLTLDVADWSGRPTSAEIRRAVLRAFVDAGGRWIDPDTVTYGYAFFMGQFDYHVRVPSVDIVASEKRLGGYRFDLRLYLELSMSPEMQGLLDDTRRGLLSGALDFVNRAYTAGTPPVITHDFVITEEGWKSPTMALELSAQNLSFLEGLLR